ncbi:hypothetical protein PAMP_008395 [Pampus punctatissimus]
MSHHASDQPAIFEKVQYIKTLFIIFILFFPFCCLYVELCRRCKGSWYLEFDGSHKTKLHSSANAMNLSPRGLSRCIRLHCDPFSKPSVLIGQTLLYVPSQSVMPELPSWPRLNKKGPNDQVNLCSGTAPALFGVFAENTPDVSL